MTKFELPCATNLICSQIWLTTGHETRGLLFLALCVICFVFMVRAEIQDHS